MSDADAQTGWNPARGGHPEVLLRLKHLTPHPDRNATTHRQNRLAASDGIHLLSAGCYSIDKQAAPSDYPIAGRKTREHLDRVAIGEPDLDPPQFDRLFTVLVAHDPDAGSFALVNDGIARDRDRVVTFTGED